ncbi:2231_t:CDS:2, partial [Acaulospora colombiana]
GGQEISDGHSQSQNDAVATSKFGWWAAIPGIPPYSPTAVYASAGDVKQVELRSGRQT